MSTVESRWELDEVEISRSAVGAALSVVRRATREKDDATAQWATAVRLAQANGASLRDIAEVAGASPQTISKVCRD